MLQIRAGRCPHCDEEVSSEATICPNCGRALDWNHASNTSKVAPDTAPGVAPLVASTSSSPSYGRMLMWFLAACVLTVAAAVYRSKSGDGSSPELSSEHATLVQDAEEFRTQIAAAQTSPDAAETTYVIGTAMPNGKDVLEITVKNEWKRLDYPTRLNYAAKFVERWKAIHAPHRANILILSEKGAEIGGRSWNGTVWVDEKQPNDTKRAKPKTAPTNAAPQATSSTPDDTATDNSSSNAATGASKERASTPGATAQDAPPPANDANHTDDAEQQ
jgi:hypothetical protein